MTNEKLREALKNAFDGDDVATKNIALRKAYDALSTPCVEQDADEVTRIERILRKHIVCDATGLSPTVASVFLQGFREAAVEILSTPPSKADADDVERVARLVEPVAWSSFDSSCQPYMENRGSYNEEFFWYEKTWKAGCRSVKDVRKWWETVKPPLLNHTVSLWRESLSKSTLIHAALSAIQNRKTRPESDDAGLREAYDAAAYLIECLDAVSRGVPVRNLDEAWERYGNARAALQMGGEKP